MKIWNEYASEHSMKLVMIGRFKSIRDAANAKALLDSLTRQAEEEWHEYGGEVALEDRRFSDEMMALLRESNLYSIGPTELQQLVYDHNVERQGKEISVSTDEVEVSTFLKILIEKGGRVDVYSAHYYPDPESGVET